MPIALPIIPLDFIKAQEIPMLNNETISPLMVRAKALLKASKINQ